MHFLRSLALRSAFVDLDLRRARFKSAKSAKGRQITGQIEKVRLEGPAGLSRQLVPAGARPHPAPSPQLRGGGGGVTAPGPAAPRWSRSLSRQLDES